jgi:hypothetical protein
MMHIEMMIRSKRRKRTRRMRKRMTKRRPLLSRLHPHPRARQRKNHQVIVIAHSPLMI